MWSGWDNLSQFRPSANVIQRDETWSIVIKKTSYVNDLVRDILLFFDYKRVWNLFGRQGPEAEDRSPKPIKQEIMALLTLEHHLEYQSTSFLADYLGVSLP